MFYIMLSGKVFRNMRWVQIIYSSMYINICSRGIPAWLRLSNIRILWDWLLRSFAAMLSRADFDMVIRRLAKLQVPKDTQLHGGYVCCMPRGQSGIPAPA